MSMPGFINSWVARPKIGQQVSYQPSTCTTTPRMNLVSHEKVEVLFTSEESEMAKYKLKLEIPALMSKAKRGEVVRSLRKNAQYDGFRKGTIPPFIMKTIPKFVLQDCIEEVLGSAVTELDLKAIEGEANEPDIDLDKLNKTFTVGESFTFDVEVPLNKSLLDLDESPGEDVIEVQGAEAAGDFKGEAQKLMEDAENMKMKGGMPPLPDIASVAEAYAAAKDEEANS